VSKTCDPPSPPPPPVGLELPYLTPLIQVRNYLKMFLILCDETREKPTVTPATRQSLIENNRQ
jgi:hypothetical protein